MSTPIRVLVVGPTGRTGTSVLEGLLNSSTDFEITGLTRESSLGKPVLQGFKERGVKLVTTSLVGPMKELVDTLTGIDVVVSCIHGLKIKDQLPLIEAAKAAGVKRFVPASFATAAPRGVMILHDQKEDILDAVQRAHLPWTSIDVGWWTNQLVPALPSGRTDKFLVQIIDTLPGDGNVPTALTDVYDVGKYTAKIISDPRTLNRKVFAYTEVLTLNQLAKIMEEVSGEKPIQKFLPADQIAQSIATAIEDYKSEEKRLSATFSLFINQYLQSWGIRGDNAPEAAKIAGYLDFKELYPEQKGRTAREIYQSILNGSEKPLQEFEMTAT